MIDYTNLTENEKQKIVKQYKKKFNTAIAIEVSAFLLLGIMILVKEYFNVKINIIYAAMTVPVIIFCFGCAMQAQLLKCPVCGKETLDDYFICPTCGWEYDGTVEENEYSSCNKATIADYRKENL